MKLIFQKKKIENVIINQKKVSLSMESENSSEEENLSRPVSPLSVQKRRNRDAFLDAFENRGYQEQSLLSVWKLFSREDRPSYENARLQTAKDS